MDDRNQVTGARTDRFVELHEPASFCPGQEDPQLRHPLQQHLVLGFEKFGLSSVFVFSAGAQLERERLEEPSQAVESLLIIRFVKVSNCLHPDVGVDWNFATFWCRLQTAGASR